MNGKLLVTKDDSTEHYYLPGGRVTMREKAEDALTRELKEELGVTVAPERAMWIAQSFFTLTGKKQRYHELCTYFTVDASGTDLITRGDRFDSPNELSVHFAWFLFEELLYIDLRPAFETEVQNLPSIRSLLRLGLTHVHCSPSFHPTNALVLSSLTIDFSALFYNQDKNIVLNRRSYHEKTLAFSFFVLCRKPRIPCFSVAPASARITACSAEKGAKALDYPAMFGETKNEVLAALDAEKLTYKEDDLYADAHVLDRTETLETVIFRSTC